MKKIFIIIVNYHGEKDTEELLASLESVHHKDFEYEVVIVNNDIRRGGFDDPPHGTSHQTCPYKIKIINNEKNLGFAAANNQGIKYALENGADYICLLNNDTTVAPDFLNELLHAADGDDKIGIISPKIYFSAGREFHKERYKPEDLGKVIWYAGGILDWQNVYGSHRGVDEVDRGQYDAPQETDFATGCCMLIKNEVFDKIGFFAEEYFAYLEDVDYCVRARRAGYKIFYEPKSIIWHKNASSSGGPGSALHFFLQERNRLYFGFKYAGGKAKIHLFKKFLQYLLSKNYRISLSLIKMFT